MYYRQQDSSYFPFPFPGYQNPNYPQGNVNQRLDQIERRLERHTRRLNRLNRRVSRIERRLGYGDGDQY
jgi:cell division septum initiation protein DivIVA